MDLKLQLLKAIRNNDDFSFSILLERLLQTENLEDLIEYINNKKCTFCDTKCDNPECTLIPKENLNV